MKRLLICAASLFGISGVLSASSVISCGGTSALLGTTTCSNSVTFSNVLQTFQLDLQWNNSSSPVSGTLTPTNPNAPASANGMAYDTVWDSVGLPMTFAISGSGLDLADNYVDVKRGAVWRPATMYSGMPANFQGTFDAPPDTAPPSGTAPGNPGDYLLGSVHGAPITIKTVAANVFLTGFGFRIASQDLTSFDVVINLLDVSGAVIETLNASNYPALANLSGGGICAGLAATGTAAPVPCNTAPFVVVVPNRYVSGFTVTTTNTSNGADTGGFYMDSMYFNAVPEPASMLLTGIGIASLMAFARRRNRRQA